MKAAILALVAAAAASAPAPRRVDAPQRDALAPRASDPASADAPRRAGEGSSSVRGSKHDFSVTGPGPVKAISETQVCVFCHVPHGNRDRMNARPDTAAKHRPYESSTARRLPGAPTGATRICLSCHDGTIAVGDTVRGKIAMRGGVGGRLAPGTRANLGTDLRSSHPVSFAPETNEHGAPPPKGDPVRLDGAGQLQCTSCHDPHKEFVAPGEGHFLVKSNQRSALCVTCHLLSVSGGGSSHLLSTAALSSGSALASSYRSVADAGCMACHENHQAELSGRLVRKTRNGEEDDVCLECHATRTTRFDIGRERAKPSAHVSPTAGVHDAAEGPATTSHALPERSISAPRHVTCVDCHDPHAARTQPATAPAANGALAGVWGIDIGGQRVAPVRFEYEVCLKCHGDSANRPQRSVSASAFAIQRAAADANLRRVFEPSAPSYHPVAAPGRASSVPSLKAPLGPGSLIYCSDCHASDTAASGSGPRGPHGSMYAPLLERNYSTQDQVPESEAAYALCYKCHDRSILLSARSSFPLHRKHLQEGRSACAACHSAHGVSRLAGNPVNNAHLIDFDLSVVKPDVRGRREYVSRGIGGTCTLTCHGTRHTDAAY